MRLLVVAFLVAFAGVPAGAQRSPVPNLARIVVVVFENNEYET